MAKTAHDAPLLLRWSDHVPASDVQDPLGLGLRGSTRLASRLLYCITSITPRARYFSFIPWCVYDYQQREQGKPYASGLRDGIILREQALTLGCIAHHEGEPCTGGGLVGSRSARKWYAKGASEANFKTMKRFTQGAALGQYLNSVVNLGLFLTDGERSDVDEEASDEALTFDDIELSELGVRLAKSLDGSVGQLAAVKKVAAKERACSLAELAVLGDRGGLCELARQRTDEQSLLREIFFDLVGRAGEADRSHGVRRQSLLLILELCRQFSAAGWHLDESGFCGAVYYGEVANDDERFEVEIPSALRDVAMRWRMFYFHHYMAVALEGMFAWVVTQLSSAGLAGQSVDVLVAQLNDQTLPAALTELLGLNGLGIVGDLTPAMVLQKCGASTGRLDDELSRSIDQAVPSFAPMAEDTLEEFIRDTEHLYASTGLAIPLLLLATTLGRFQQWEGSNYGKWLANVASDSFLDLVPPLVTLGLTRHFGDWWNTPFQQLARFILSRYIVQQHQTMSYEKTWTGDRCLLQVDGPKIVSLGAYEKIGLGNPRLNSALQILIDLGLIEDGDDDERRLTSDGKAFLGRELAKESDHEVP